MSDAGEFMVELSERDIALLPRTLREMVGAIGLPATLTLVRHYGGTRLYVPKAIGPEHPLARLLGLEAAARLAKEYGGQYEHFSIPRALAALRELRNRRIRRQHALGKSRRELAREHSLTERAIDYITGDGEAPETQGGLFE